MRYAVSILLMSIVISGCKHPAVVSDFCKQIETIGYQRMLTQFSDDELRALKLDRKRALLALRSTYERQCK